jgi:hypothetical protein
MNLAGYALRPPRGPKDAMLSRLNCEFGTVISSNVKKEWQP